MDQFEMTDPKQVLDLPMGRNDAEADTVREYLKALLTQLWAEGEGFSGKRPFGNSGWEREIYIALVKGRAVPGKIFEEEGYEHLDRFSDTARKKADKLIFKAIEALA